MTPETNPAPSLPPVSTEESHSSSVPLFLSASSSSLKPLRERNRTNLKRRINLSRSQVLSNDFENDEHSPTTNSSNKPTTATNNSQPAPSTPTSHTLSEKYAKTVSPTTPSPIHATVTCSQVWERLASSEDAPTSTSPPPVITSVTPPTSSMPTHISFSYEPSDDDDDDEEDDVVSTKKDDFQYVPVSSQSKLVQFQFLTFARQQQSLFTSDLEHTEPKDSDDSDDEETITDHNMEEDDEQQQENRACNKRKRSVSTTDSLGDRSSLATTSNADAASSSSVAKPPRTKKPKIKDPNANFQLLNMKKKSFSHAKKHQFGKNKRNAFYRRTRYAGGHK